MEENYREVLLEVTACFFPNKFKNYQTQNKQNK